MEAFHLQGIHYGARHDVLRVVDSNFLTNLSGNAFMTWCFAACLMVKETLLAICTLESETATAARIGLYARPRDRGPDEQDDDEVDSVLEFG